MTTTVEPAGAGQAETDARERLIAAADEARESGDYRAAIDLLTDANSMLATAELERRLLDLRIQGFRHLAWPSVDWSGDYEPVFAREPGLPEVGPEALSASILRAGILGKGGLIVRGLMGAEQASLMRENIDRALRARRGLAEGSIQPGENAWYDRPDSVAGGPVQFGSLGGNQYTDSGSVWAVDSPPAAFQLIEFYRGLGLQGILREYFGEPAMLSVRKWVLRCVVPNNGSESGWHQDGRFMGDGIRTVNLWIALSDCGEGADAPGIDIVAGNERRIYETGTRGAVFDWTVGPGLVDEIGQRQPVLRPHFKAGDAVFFDHYNLHRTAFGTDHHRNRYALESWFFAASRAPQKQQPLIF
jgi:hypothetical protein